MQCTKLSSPEEPVIVPCTVLTEDLEQETAAPHQLETESVELIPDCLEHIFKYLPTSDKGRVSQVLL